MSTATIYDRWFLTPATTFEETDSNGNVVETVTAPKYHDTDGIAGFAGNIVDESIVNDSYPALIQIYPDVNGWYIVRMYGRGNAGWNAVNVIHNYQDTRTLADHANDVKPVLDERFPDMARSGAEWAESFTVVLG